MFAQATRSTAPIAPISTQRELATPPTRSSFSERTTGVMRVFTNFRYTDQLEASDGVHALVFRADVGDREVEGIDLVRINGDDLIDDFTVFVRPLSGLNALAARMAQVLGSPTPAPS